MTGLVDRKLPTFPCFAAVTSTLHAGSNVLMLPGSGLITSTGARSGRLVHVGELIRRRMKTFGRGQSRVVGMRRRIRDVGSAFDVRMRKILRD